jgi:subtilase family serine protease
LVTAGLKLIDLVEWLGRDQILCSFVSPFFDVSRTPPSMLSILGTKKKLTAIFCGIVVIAGASGDLRAQAQPTGDRVTFAGSIREPAGTATNTLASANQTPTVVRTQLTPAETQALIDFSIALKMRNPAELEQRIANREILSLDEISAKYFPTAAETEAIRSWLVAQGFEVIPAEPHELSVFARGTVTRLQQVFGVTFGRVQFAGEEHTSALSPPSLPSNIAGRVLSVNGLQPHLHPFVHFIGKTIGGPGKSISNSAPYLVSEIAKAYGAALGNGAGQKIGIVIDTFPSDSDLSAFWADNSVPQSLSNIEKIQVVAGTLPSPSDEATLDVS